ncbi:FAD-binding oxidoreductase [Streptomyces sp. V1I1]|uniref:FAD-binding oxidoreductase n=1 Tax=Streptomyces sp. V1I1 TaxID=3042272 RepID=UPI0027D7C960|nr:hypothetical protein [Streptomyces sp. V1I1]
MSSDNLVAADVVTADGRLVHASTDENPDLLCALRGGGGNFGVVTSFEYQLHPVGPHVPAGLIVYPLAEARQVIAKWRDLTAEMPDEPTTLVNLTTAPPLPFLPEDVHGTRIVVIASMYASAIEAGEAAVRPPRPLGTPIADIMGPMPYVAMQSPAGQGFRSTPFRDQGCAYRDRCGLNPP